MNAVQTKLEPDLRFPEFDGNWNRRNLGAVTAWASGGTPSKVNDSYWNGDIPWISASSMRGSVYNSSDLKISEAGLRSGSKLAKKGTLLLLVRGSMLFKDIPVGVAGRDVAFNQDVKALAVKDVDSSYLLAWFQASKNKLLHMVVGTGIGAGKLDTDELKSMPVLLPDDKEQQKIADFLSAVDRKIQQLGEKHRLLTEYKKGVMQRIFSQQIRFTDDNGQPYPDWEEMRLGDMEDEGLIEMGRGKVISKIDIKELKGDYPIYSSSVNNNALFGAYGDYMFDEELISWSVDGGGHFFYRPKHRFSVTNVCGYMRMLSSRLVCSFMAYNLQFLHQKLVFDYQTKAHPSVIRKLYILGVPTTEEQQKIADLLGAIDNKIDQVSKQLEQVQAFKKGLLQQMFI